MLSAERGFIVAKRIDLFDTTYSHFTKQVLETIRQETFGRDIGQNSWTTIEEYDRFISWLDLRPGYHVLEVASGSGGPARYLANSAHCRVTGIDANEAGVATATQSVAESNQADRITFRIADANSRLPFDDNFFDAVICVDSMNKDALIKIEGEERFDGLQKFFAAVHGLTSERRLSRIVYLVEKQDSL